MKRSIYLVMLSGALLLTASSTYAQRPEAVYVNRAAKGLSIKRTAALQTGIPGLGFPGVNRIAAACPTCQQISFATYSPDQSYISINGADSVWKDTYKAQVSDPVYTGGFLNFTSGCFTFTHYADTTFGATSYWDGFTVSKTTSFPCDTACADDCNGLPDQFASITKGGVGGATDPYAVSYYGYNADFFPVNHSTISLGSVTNLCGLYVTNTAYVAKVIKCGDPTFLTNPFTHGDSLVLTITGYNGTTPTGSVSYTLADYRNATQAYIVDAWKWVNLTSLGAVDNLVFTLTTSDVGDFGPNTPMYFAIDGIKAGTDPSCGTCAATDTTHNWFPIGQSGARTATIATATAPTSNLLLSASPNPARSEVLVNTKAGSLLEVFDAAGHKTFSKKLTTNTQVVPVNSYVPGTYIIRVTNGSNSRTTQFIKQ